MIGSYLVNKNKDKLNEAVEVEGARFLGNGTGFDVFDITTWHAAQSFVKEGTTGTAGDCWWRSNENIFNNHVNDTVKFFVITRENTNNVVLGILKGIGDTVLRVGSNGARIKLINYAIQTGVDEDNFIPENLGHDIPLYLLPDFQYEGENGLGFDGDKIIGNYSGLVENIPARVVIPENITTIESYALENYTAAEVELGPNITTMRSRALFGYSGSIYVDQFASAFEAHWPEDWTNSRSIHWEANLSDEEKQARVLAKIRYKVEGKNIVILGAKKNVDQLEIPETIDGKQVTKVAPFAFYDNINIRKVVLPRSIKEIGKAAFMGCRNLNLTYPKTAVLYSDALEGIRSANRI